MCPKFFILHFARMLKAFVNNGNLLIIADHWKWFDDHLYVASIAVKIDNNTVDARHARLYGETFYALALLIRA